MSASFTQQTTRGIGIHISRILPLSCSQQTSAHFHGNKSFPLSPFSFLFPADGGIPWVPFLFYFLLPLLNYFAHSFIVTQKKVYC
jgi:hypothetical protein